MIIGFAGKIGVGKSTTSNWFVDNKKFLLLSYGYPIKAALVKFTGLPMKYFTDPALKEQLIPGLPGITPRIMMQKLGTEYARNMIFRDFFIWRMEKAIEKHCDRDIVIDDIRFDNEADLVRKYNGTVIQLYREFKSPTNEQSHSSETGISLNENDRVVHCLQSPESTAQFIWGIL